MGERENVAQTTLGERIMLARKRAGMRQEDVADALGTDRTRISEWERDEAVPESRYLLRLPEILGVSADVLFYGRLSSGVPTPPAEAVAALIQWYEALGLPVPTKGKKRASGNDR